MKFSNERIAVTAEPMAGTAVYFDRSIAFRSNSHGDGLQPIARYVFNTNHPFAKKHCIQSEDLHLNSRLFVDQVYAQTLISIVNDIFHEDQKIRSKERAECKLYHMRMLFNRREYYYKPSLLFEELLKIGFKDLSYDDIKKHIDNTLVLNLTEKLRSFGIWAYPIFQDLSDNRILNRVSNKCGINDSVIEVSLIDAPEINCNNISWDAVSELRNDKEAIRSILKFREFLSGLERNCSAEHYQQLMYEKLFQLEKAIKNHDVELKYSTLDCLLSSKSLQTAAGMLVGSILFGSSDPSIISSALAAGGTIAGVNAMFDLGRCSLKISKSNYFRRERVIAGSEVEYLYYVKNKIGEVF